MLEIFFIVVSVIALSLIGYISIIHNNHKSEVEELERALESKDRMIDKYIIKELKNELKKNNKDVSKSHYKILSWEESVTEWTKFHENHYDFISVQHKKFDDEPCIVIEYKIKNSKDELRNNNQIHLNYKAMWEELREDVNDAINNPNPEVKPVVKASAMKVFENTLNDMNRLEDKYKDIK